MKARTIAARNVNDAIVTAGWYMQMEASQENSRNGLVIVAPGPVITEYSNPRERILFAPWRDANPVFHLMECIWMMAGENHVGWLEQFNSRMGQYAEPSGVIHGAYGYRWAHHFGFDQLLHIAQILRDDPTSRQAVLQMWSAEHDLGAKVKDKPCNTHVYFDARGGVLNMTVCCRSNDMIWGAYGANVVHFSFLQECLAHELDIPVGTYWQVSNNFHIYVDNPAYSVVMGGPPELGDPYIYQGVLPANVCDLPLVDYRYACGRFVAGVGTNSAFLENVARPLMNAYLSRRAGKSDGRLHNHSCDWFLAYDQWLDRRMA